LALNICFAQVQRRATLAAFRDLIGGIARIHAVLSSAVSASYYRHHLPLSCGSNFDHCRSKVSQNNLAGFDLEVQFRANGWPLDRRTAS
jgi:hypothetical protein